MNFEDSIAHTAHGYVHGERAKSYGHPRFDFGVIAKVWTGLLQDLLKEDAELDPYRVAVLMTGLKLARLVKSPDHKDSRIDTIGYMLTMERLDEPVTSGNSRPCGDLCPEPEGTPCCEPDEERHESLAHEEGIEDEAVSDCNNDDYEDDCGCLAGACECERISWEYKPGDVVPGVLGGGPQMTFSQIKLWFEPGETKYVNGQGIVNPEKDCGKIIVIPIAPGTNDITISPHPPAQNPLTGKPLGEDSVVADLCKEHNADHECTVKEVHTPPSDLIHPVRDWDDLNKKWMCGHAENDHGQVHVGECLRRQQAQRQLNAVTHNHEQQAPCMPGCPVWASSRPFEFTGEQVKVTPHDG